MDIISNKQKNIIWSPLEGSQTLFLLLGQHENLVKELLFCGSRGNGKSDCLIMGFVQHINKGWGEEWNGIIFRKQLKPLEDLISKSNKIIKKAFPDAKYNKSSRKWTFSTGETLTFEQIETIEDYNNKYHGHEYSYIAFDELTTWADSEIYETMISCLRTSYQPTLEQPNLPPLQIRSATNSYGQGRIWVRERFIEGKEYGVPSIKNGKLDRIAIFGFVGENKYIDESYINDFLMEIKDPLKRASWLTCDWFATDIGAFFSPVWKKEKIVIKPFVIPSRWKVSRCFDFGQSTPFANLWVAESNGEDVIYPDGTVFTAPKGSIFVVDELYGTEEDKFGNQVEKDKGLFLSPKNIAKMILDKEKLLKQKLLKESIIEEGPADTQIWNGSKNEKGKSKTVAREMEQEGLTYTQAYKGPGSRSASSQIMFERLSSTIDQDPENPHIYFFDNCKYCIQTIPQLQRDEKDITSVKKAKDDHCWDALAYKLTEREKPKTGKLNIGI